MRTIVLVAVAVCSLAASGAAYAGSGVSADGTLSWSTDGPGLTGSSLVQPDFNASQTVVGDTYDYYDTAGDVLSLVLPTYPDLGGNGGPAVYGGAIAPNGDNTDISPTSLGVENDGPSPFGATFTQAVPQLYFGALLNFNAGDYSVSFQRGGQTVLTVSLPPYGSPVPRYGNDYADYSFGSYYSEYLNVVSTGDQGYDQVIYNVGAHDPSNGYYNNELNVYSLSYSTVGGVAADVDEPAGLGLSCLAVVGLGAYLRRSKAPADDGRRAEA